MRNFSALAAALWTAAALAQGPGAGEPRIAPPEPPTREAAPDGEPGAPKAPPAPETGAPADNRAREAAERCAELPGAMRAQCLREAQLGAAGATAPPAPRTAPPPQNPR
ncbi:MAG TPA: hypothetical protein VF211_12075 [Burkholderiales bacterium]